MLIGERLRELRKERELTLKNLADRSGLSITYLSDVERGRTMPSLKMVQRVAEAFELSTTNLLDGVENFGDSSDISLPQGLQKLKDDPVYAGKITDEWIRSLMRVDFRGKRPESKEDWERLYLFLYGMLKK
jgi:XRE family transcriptional regulator, regulator of sulfur utilization